MQSYSYHLFHSAKGTSWKSKDHKYIAIENGRYIYPDDVAKGKSSSAMNSQGSVNRYEQAKQSVQKQPVSGIAVTGGARFEGKNMTPSEYRAAVERKKQITNEDGSIRANSPEARGDENQAVKSAKASKKSTGSQRKLQGLKTYASGTKTQFQRGTEMHNKKKVSNSFGTHISRHSGSGSKASSSTKKHGMNMDQYVKSTMKTPVHQMKLSDAGKAVDVGKSVVDSMFYLNKKFS